MATLQLQVNGTTRTVDWASYPILTFPEAPARLRDVPSATRS